MNLIPQKEVLIYFFFLQIWSKSFLFVKQKKERITKYISIRRCHQTYWAKLKSFLT
jgi:hypothetical protein